jgi:hypothetical protein
LNAHCGYNHDGGEECAWIYAAPLDAAQPARQSEFHLITFIFNSSVIVTEP